MFNSCLRPPACCLGLQALRSGQFKCSRSLNIKLGRHRRLSLGSAISSGVSASSTSQPGLYKRPDLYQSVFSYRNFELEVKFLQASFRKHAQGSREGLQSVLDLGCGPGEHALGLALGGVQTVVGLDLSRGMITHAEANARRKGAACQLDSGQLRFVQGNMCNFRAQSLLGGSGGFDMVTCLLGTFSSLLDNTQALQAFSCTHNALNPGGLFVLELSHPGDLFDGSLIWDETQKEMWEVEKTEEGSKLLVEWGDETDKFDPVTQVIERLVCVTEIKGQSGEEIVVEDHVPARQFTAQEVDLLARATGLEVVELYGDMEQGISLTHEEAYRLVAVLRKSHEG
ncbi:S-adenosyl-L-methionine-dependent methyltransferase [Dunaliella salina]|uniref:S-adenosyl-L-methionine-dependent methyltransferase n=1 Tax=Dunaliella salina TaxID=3046 RepID=A0ABQ7GE27_DUNSA|nr:S-adenosyl-L-methionine-dependent methyltransferase [Dunaliella salina]|eukprot:KAF5832812.1 S-adenosyl-L-methionine-dependent methyltransferase [Dunaliella salina]